MKALLEVFSDCLVGLGLIWAHVRHLLGSGSEKQDLISSTSMFFFFFSKDTD